MNGWRIFYIIFLSFLLPGTVVAQKVFSEGVITYAVTMEKPGIDGKARGTYTIYVKNSYVRKELKMDNGFEFVMILEGKDKGYLLKQTKEKNYAVLLDMNERSDKYERYRYYDLTAGSKNKEIAGYTSMAAEVRYKDGSTSELYLAKELKLTNQNVFDRYPAIELVPLEFTVRNDEGMTMHFTANKVILKPMDSGHFRVPEGYVVVDRDETSRPGK